ncbi:MAG: dipeptidase [Pseudomonadota bacterium]
MKYHTARLLAMAALLPFHAQARTPEAVAAAALKAAPVWDGHNDAPAQLRERTGNVLAGFDFSDTRNTADPAKDRVAMHTDIARLRAGRVGAQFWSVYVPARLSDPQAVQAVIEQIDVTRRLIEKYPNDLQFAETADDVVKAFRSGRVASLIGMEGGYAIAGSPGVLRQFRALGVRYMTLVHSKSTDWADSATDSPRNGGLSAFGKDIVREMQRIGMLVDLSHCSEATMLAALDAARAPVIFSHSGARAIDDHPRNVPDGVLARIKSNGGVVMAITLPDFVSQQVRDWALARAAEKARLDLRWIETPDRASADLATWEQANPAPRATIAQVANHIDHVVRLAGVDHVGIGADFDGMDATTQGLDDVSAYPALFAELARRGYSQAALEKIASGNMLRALRAADAYALTHRADPALEKAAPF